MHTEGQLGTQLQDPQPRERGGTGPGAGRGHRDRGLTIALDHVAAGVADISKELWTERVLNMLQAFVPQAQSQECGPHPPPKGQLSAATCQGTASGLRAHQNSPLGKTAGGGTAPPKAPLLPPVS